MLRQRADGDPGQALCEINVEGVEFSGPRAKVVDRAGCDRGAAWADSAPNRIPRSVVDDVREIGVDDGTAAVGAVDAGADVSLHLD